MTTVLITGFEPFGENLVNPSYEAVRLLPDQIKDTQIIKGLLPVTFGGAAEVLRHLLQTYSPDITICVGLAGGRSAITPEMIGINMKNARIPDNNGNQPQWEKIAEDGEDGLFSTLPVQEMVRWMQEAEIPAEISCSAGTYVCNEVLYQPLRMTKEGKVRAGFIHVPYMAGVQEGQPAMELEDIVRGLRICIETAVMEKVTQCT